MLFSTLNMRQATAQVPAKKTDTFVSYKDTQCPAFVITLIAAQGAVLISIGISLAEKKVK